MYIYIYMYTLTGYAPIVALAFSTLFPAPPPASIAISYIYLRRFFPVPLFRLDLCRNLSQRSSCQTSMTLGSGGSGVVGESPAHRNLWIIASRLFHLRSAVVLSILPSPHHWRVSICLLSFLMLKFFIYPPCHLFLKNPLPYFLKYMLVFPIFRGSYYEEFMTNTAFR